MQMSLRKVGCKKIIRGIPIRGKEETKKVFKGLLSVRQRGSGVEVDSVSSRTEMIYNEVCSNLDAYNHYRGYLTEEALGTLFHNSEITITSIGEETYILKIDIPFQQRDVVEIFASSFLRIERAVHSVEILLNFWPFLPSFQIDFKELAEMFPQLPGFSVANINAGNALDRFKFERSCVLAQGKDFDVRFNLKGVNVLERVKLQENRLIAPYSINQLTDAHRRDLFEEPAVVLSIVGKNEYIVDEEEKQEVFSISREIEKHFLKSVHTPEDCAREVLPIRVQDLLVYPFHPRLLCDDILMCQIFRKLLFLAEDSDIVAIPRRLKIIKKKMREIVEIWEERGYMVGVNEDDSQPNVAEICAREIQQEAQRITNALWKNPAEKVLHKRKLTTRVRPIQVVA